MRWQSEEAKRRLNRCETKERSSAAKDEVYGLVLMDEIPSDAKVIGYRFVNKVEANGEYKSTLVVHYNSQLPGMNHGAAHL